MRELGARPTDAASRPQPRPIFLLNQKEAKRACPAARGLLRDYRQAQWLQVRRSDQVRPVRAGRGAGGTSRCSKPCVVPLPNTP